MKGVIGGAHKLPYILYCKFKNDLAIMGIDVKNECVITVQLQDVCISFVSKSNGSICVMLHPQKSATDFNVHM